MNVLWKLLRFLPNGVVRSIKEHTSSDLRLWIRERFGASSSSIPEGIRAVSDGRRFLIGPDCIYWAIHMGLDFEAEATEVVRRLVKPGNTVVDVGANFGWYATLCAQAVGESGRVFAFEPVPSTYDRLSTNLQLNELNKQITTVQSAVGESSGATTIHIFEGKSHAYASLCTLDETNYKAIDVGIVDLDSYLADQKVQRVDFLKCDVEGSELAVLKGAQRTLQQADAPIVMVELNDVTSEAFGYKKEDIWHFLRNLGYDHFYMLRPHGKVARLYDTHELKPLDLMLCAKGNDIEKRLIGATKGRLAA